MKQSALAVSLGDYLAKMNIVLQSQQLDLLARHVELVLNANRRVNLTRVNEASDAIRLHTADSLTLLQDMLRAPDGSALDLGTGAGFPGIPLAVASGRRFVLLDSVGKKIRELNSIVSALGLSDHVETSAARAEAFARTVVNQHSVVVARAVSDLPALVELASPLLANDGLLLCQKGHPSEEEVRRGNEVAEMTGMRLEYQREFELPELAGHRTVLCYRKVARSIVKLPRREGLAQHAPLA